MNINHPLVPVYIEAFIKIYTLGFFINWMAMSFMIFHSTYATCKKRGIPAASFLAILLGVVFIRPFQNKVISKTIFKSWIGLPDTVEISIDYFNGK